MLPEIERNNWSIVLIGNFNPAIFHPAWFAMNNVISREVADSSDTEVVHSEASVMSLGALRLNIQRMRFGIETEQAPEIALLDFVSVVFGDLLPHSEIHQFGINRTVFFRASSSESRTRLGRIFAPTAPWGSFGARIEQSSGSTTGGMTTVAMRELFNETHWNGHCEAKLMPAYELDVNTGIQIAINNHFEMKDQKKGGGTKAALSIIESEFEARMTRSEEVIAAVLGHLA